MRANSSAPSVSLPANEAMHVPWHRVWKLWQLLGAQFFGTIVLMKFVLSLPVKRCMSHRPTFANHLKSLGRTVFGDNRIDEICPENPCQQLCFSVCRFFPTELSPSYFPRFPVRPPCRHSRIAPSEGSSLTISLPSTLSSIPCRSFPSELSPQFPFRPPCRHSRIAPSHRNSPLAIFPTVSLPSTLSSLPYRSFPPELSPSYFPRLPFPPPCRHSRIAPSQLSSPQAISHGFPSSTLSPLRIAPSHRALPKLFPTVSFVHPVVTLISLFPTGALPKLFPTVSLPSTLSSLSYRSFPPELSPSYFPRHRFYPPCPHSRMNPQPRVSPSYFPQFPFRPPCRHGFPSVHPVVTPVSLLPTGALPKLFQRPPFRPRSLPKPFHTVSLPLPKLFPMVSLPSALSSLLPSVHPVVTPISLLPTGALPKLFPRVSLPSTRSLPTEFSPSYFPRFPFRAPCLYRSFPPELSPSYFPRFPFRPPGRHIRIAPSHRSSPQAISHGFPSVHPVITPVSLLSTGALPQLFHTVSLPLPKLFPTVSLPSTLSSRIAPSHRSSPQAISHGFPSVHPVVTPPFRPPNRRFHPFPPNGALPKLFPMVSPPSTLSSNPYRSLAASATKREPKHRRCFWEKMCANRSVCKTFLQITCVKLHWIAS